MLPFVYQRPKRYNSAISAGADGTDAGTSVVQAATQFIAGGTNLTDYMKLGVARPDQIIDLNDLDDPDLRRIDISEDAIRFGALVRMAEVEDDRNVQRLAPVLAESLHLAASRQIRNMASLGGNILQRTRCEYFRETSWPCNKRDPGSGCAAIEGFNRQHAVLGGSDQCIATYHGDFGQALIALGAEVETRGASGRRRIAFSRLHVRPGSSPDVETILEPGEIITSIAVPINPWTARSHYLKIRDRQSYAFALASAAVALDLDGDRVRQARIALGGVATTPWRANAAEDALAGKTLDARSAETAAKAAFADAKPLQYNGFKIALGQETLVRALMETKQMRIES